MNHTNTRLLGPLLAATLLLQALPGSANDAITRKAGPHGAYDPHSSLTADKQVQVALQHKQEGRLPLAFETLNRAITHLPDSAELYSVRGSLYLETGQPSKALQDLQRALKIRPTDADTLVNRAQVYRQFGQIEQALADLDRAIELSPELVPALFNRGSIYYSSNDFQHAQADFDRCIAIDPHLAAPYFNRASARQALGDQVGANADLQRFIRLSDNPQWKATAEDLLQRWQATDGSTGDQPNSGTPNT